MIPTIIVWGSPGEGKTYYAELLRQFYGCTRIIDEWDGKDIQAGALHLTRIMSNPAWTSYARVLRLQEALKEMAI